MAIISERSEELVVDLRANGSEVVSLEEVETIQIPRNYTLFVNELKRLTFGGDGDKNLLSGVHNKHGMTDDEYDRFVSDMWIGIVLTMLMVMIVFALCFWFMYHKFQQWKRTYDARSEVRHGVTSAGAFNADIDTLPNYTLVSGLPTYDDALEQLRLSTSTNHLLINHQTFMKLFGNTQPVAAAAAATKDAKELKETQLYVGEQPLPCYDDVVGNTFSPPAPPSLASEDTASELLSDGSSASSSVRTSTVSTVDSLLSSDSIAVSRPTAHRFTCTTVQPPPLPIELNSRRMMMLRNERRRASDVPSPQFKRQSSTPLTNRPLHLIDSSSSLGSLNIIKEIRRHNSTDSPAAGMSMWSIDGPGAASSQHRGSLY